jgi:hypothetical protein
MDIATGAIGFEHLFVAAVKRTHAEFDLGEIQ